MLLNHFHLVRHIGVVLQRKWFINIYLMLSSLSRQNYLFLDIIMMMMMTVLAHIAALYEAGSIYIYSLLHTRLQCDNIYYIIAHFAAFYVARSIVILDSTLLVPVQSVWKEDFFTVITIIVVIVIVSVTIIREAIT